MPFRSKRKRRFRKFRRGFGRFKRGFRRFRRTNRPTRIKIRGNVIPDEVFTKLRLVYHVDLIYPPGGAANNVYFTKGSSLYRPGGASPAYSVNGVQAYANFFNNSIVMGSKIELNIVPHLLRNTGNDDSDNWVTGIIGLVPVLDGDVSFTPTTLIDDALEQKYAKYKRIGSGNSGNYGIKLKSFMSMTKLVGQKPLTQQNQWMQALTNTVAMGCASDPIRLWYWQWFFTPNFAQNTATNLFYGRAWIKITYYIKFFERIHVKTGPAALGPAHDQDQ